MGSRGKRAMAHGVISKLAKIKQGRRHNDCRYASDVLVVVFGRCWGKGKMMYRVRAKWIRAGKDWRQRLEEENVVVWAADLVQTVCHLWNRRVLYFCYFYGKIKHCSKLMQEKCGSYLSSLHASGLKESSWCLKSFFLPYYFIYGVGRLLLLWIKLFDR